MKPMPPKPDVSLAIKTATEFARFYPKGVDVTNAQLLMFRDALLIQRSAINKAIEYLKTHGDMAAVQDVTRGL